MGSAHVLVKPGLRRRLKARIRNHLIRVLHDTDMGDGTYLLGIETDLLPPGYHGHMDVIVHGWGERCLEFKKDVDV